MDLLCLEGFCPAMVTVEGGELRKPAVPEAGSDLNITVPDPVQKPLTGSYDILIAGVGGTGLITIGNLLGMAAHLEGKECSVLDNTGIARMGGAVTTHVRLGEPGINLNASRIENLAAKALLGSDLVVSASMEVLPRIGDEQTTAILNTYIAPTADQAENPELSVNVDALVEKVTSRVGENSVTLDATELASSLMGNKIFANILMLGIAFQKGLIPLDITSIHQAIELNASAVEENLTAFEWGRRYAVDAEAVAAFAGLAETAPYSLEQKISERTDDLAKYQNTAYAKRYTDLIAKVRDADKDQNSAALSKAVADNYYKLLAVKDEYEVARLYTDGDFEQKIKDLFEGDVKLEFHIGRNLVAAENRNTDRLKKQKFGSWFISVLNLLNGVKGLRGSLIDPFKYTKDRKRDRQLIDDYEQSIDALLKGLSAENYDLSVEIAKIPDVIRGFGRIRDRSVTLAKDREHELLAQLDNKAA
jgi:indolepyruvate ferredoxin oxidoreductase